MSQSIFMISHVQLFWQGAPCNELEDPTPGVKHSVFLMCSLLRPHPPAH